jgi:hypothetical protein
MLYQGREFFVSGSGKEANEKKMIPFDLNEK